MITFYLLATIRTCFMTTFVVGILIIMFLLPVSYLYAASPVLGILAMIGGALSIVYAVYQVIQEEFSGAPQRPWTEDEHAMYSYQTRQQWDQHHP